MRLPDEETELFHNLYNGLLCYVNRTLDIIPEADSPADFRTIPPPSKAKVRDALISRRELIDSYVAENPYRLSPEQQEMVAAWKNALVGKFIVYRDLKRYTVFLTAEGPPQAYGVVSLATEIVQLLPRGLPAMVDAVLLPFRGRIVPDGLMLVYGITFGPGIRGSFDESYRKAKSESGVIEELPLPGQESRMPVARRRPAGLPPKELAAILVGIEREVARLKAGDDPGQKQAFELLRSAAAIALAVTQPTGDTEDLVPIQRRLRRAQKLAANLWNTLEGMKWGR